MNQLNFTHDGKAEIADPFGRKIILNPEEVRRIAAEHELLQVIENVKTKLAKKSNDSMEARDNNGEYDYEKYPPDVIRTIAKNIIGREINNESIQETYWLIVDMEIDDYYEAVDTDYSYEIYGKEGEIIDDGYAALESAIEYALENNGYTINKVWYPLNKNNEIDYNADITAAHVVWEWEKERKHSTEI